MAFDPASAALFDKHRPDTSGGIVTGTAGERRARLLELYANQAHGLVLWLVDSPAAVASVRAALPASCLEPGILTVRQAADRFAGTIKRLPLPLGPATKRALIAELAANAQHRDSLGPLQELVESPGFIDLLASRFRQLRRDAITADGAGDMLRRLDGGRAGRVLAGLYRDYLLALDRGALIDEEGLTEAATELVSQNPTTYRRVLVDLPQGVCRVEQRFIQAIAASAQDCYAACPAPPNDAPSTDRLPATFKRQAEWTDLLGISVVGQAQTTTPIGQSTAVQSIAERLFHDCPSPAEDARGVRVLAGSSSHDTARRVARHVKLLLRRGTEPHDIVLAAPQLERSAPRYLEALTEYGVPIAIDLAPRLATAPAAQAAIDLLALADSDWSFDSLTTLLRRSDLPQLGSGRSASGFASSRVAAEWFVRELQVPSGQRYLRRQAEQIASRPSASDRFDRLREAGDAAVGVFESLASATEDLPQEATPLAWFDAIDTALRRLGHQGLTNSADPVDRAAGDTIEEACASLESLAGWRGRQPRQLRLSSMLELLRGWATRLRLPKRGSSEGRVRLMGTSTAAGLPCKHLIVIETDETAFASPTGDTDDAMLDFYELATTASDSLTFAYAALDASAQPMLPSPYVTEVERLFTPGATREDNEPLLGCRLLEHEPASSREWRQRAVQRATAGDTTELAACDTSRVLTAKLAAVASRSRGEAFGVWEGVLESSATQAYLAERYGPQHLWSASQLELMATCPFKFFSRQVLRLEEAGELTLGVDHRRRGSLMHDALAECLAQIVKELPKGKTLRDVPDDELSQRLIEWIERLGDTGKLPRHEAALAAIEARQTSDWAARYAEQQRRFHAQKQWNNLDQPLTPTLLEARFGPASGEADGAEDHNSTDQPFEFTLPGGEVMRLVGRIDRIDTAQLDGRTLYSVVDYKTSKQLKASRAEMESGKQLQPVLYAMAARELFLDQDAVPVAAGYWAVRQKGFVAPSEKELPLMSYDNDGRLHPSDAWQEVVDAVRARCESLVTGIRSGQFPMFNDDEHCGRRCEYRTTCRVAQARSLGKLPASREGGDS